MITPSITIDGGGNTLNANNAGRVFFIQGGDLLERGLDEFG